MKLRSPSEISASTPTRGSSVNDLAEDFVNNALAKEIEGVIAQEKRVVPRPSPCVNVAVPVAAYNCMDEFLNACVALLRPLGYEAEASHDGGGMYSTLAVTWSWPAEKTTSFLVAPLTLDERTVLVSVLNDAIKEFIGQGGEEDAVETLQSLCLKLAQAKALVEDDDQPCPLCGAGV